MIHVLCANSTCTAQAVIQVSPGVDKAKALARMLSDEGWTDTGEPALGPVEKAHLCPRCSKET